MSQKIACVLVPDLPIQLEQQRRNLSLPILIPHPLDHSAIFAASPEATEAGVQIGMSLYQAQQMAPTALVIEPDELAYHSCHGAVLAALQAYSPLFETADLGEFLVDVRGLERLHGDDAALASALVNTAQAAAGLAVQVGIAAGKFVAEQAARQAPANGAVVVPPGAEAGFLAPLPVTVLPHLPGEMRRRLALLDLHGLGDLAALRKPAVLRQFGAEISGLYELARGNDPRALDPTAPPLCLVRSLRLAGPVSERAVLLNALQRLSRQMARALNAQGYHAEGLKLTLYTTSGAAREIGQAAKPPTADEARLGRLAALLLGKLSVSEPVVVVALSAYPLRSWHLGLHQISLAERGVVPPFGKQARFETALQVLVHRFGELVLRVAALIGPPVPLPVTVTIGDEGRLVSYALGGEENPVVEVENTWREERDWWSRPLRRDYFRVRLPDDSLHKLYQDLVDEKWYLDRSWPIL